MKVFRVHSVLPQEWGERGRRVTKLPPALYLCHFPRLRTYERFMSFRLLDRRNLGRIRLVENIVDWRNQSVSRKAETAGGRSRNSQLVQSPVSVEELSFREKQPKIWG